MDIITAGIVGAIIYMSIRMEDIYLFPGSLLM